MRKPLRFWLGTLTVFLLALTPSVVPVGDIEVPAFASAVEVDEYMYLHDVSDAGSGTGLSDGVTANGVIPATGDFTAEAWILPESINNANEWHQVFQQSGNSSSNYGRFGLNVNPGANNSATGIAGFQVIYDGINLNVSNATSHPRAQISQGVWSHVAVTVDWDPSNTVIRLFLNGTEVGSTSGNPNQDSIRTDGFTVGYFPENFDTTDRHFHGGIDQVKVWGGVLSSTQIRESMNVFASDGVSSAPSLLTHLDFNGDYSDSTGSKSFSTVGTVSRETVAQSSTVGSDIVLTFPRSYLTAQGGWTVPAGVTEVDYLIVAGGGGGGGRHGGGGGAGGLLQGTDFAVTPSATASLIVGTGGKGSPFLQTNTSINSISARTEKGGNSTALGLTAFGGGTGAGKATAGDTLNGGSGAGGECSLDICTVGSAVSGQGNSGGRGTGGQNGEEYTGGGGGGAGGAGVAALSAVAGAGGSGVSSSITGSAVLYAAGGGGGAYAGHQAGAGGSSGVGGSGGAGAAGTNGLSGRGGGGGGGGHRDTPTAVWAYAGGDGGTGVVIVRYVDPIPGPPTSTSVVTGDGQITVAYTLPAHTGGGTLSLEYQLTPSGGSAGAWTPLGETDGSTVISTGVTNGTVYTVKLRAKNTSGGSSFTSSEVTVGTVIPSAVGEVFRLDATRSDSFTTGDSVWADVTGNIDGSLQGTPNFLSTSKTFDMDGTSDWFDLPNLAVDFSSGFALHYVADFGAAQDYERVIDFSLDGSNKATIQLARHGTSNAIYFETRAADGSSGSGKTCISGSSAIQPGLHAYSIVITDQGVCTHYRNGVAQGSSTTDLGLIPVSVERQGVNIGQYHSGIQRFEGALQSVILYNTAQVIPTCKPVESTFAGNGTIGVSGADYQVLQFTTGGPCEWTAPSGVTSVEYLLVAGGGGGGGHIAGGGGAGEMAEGTKSGITPGSTYVMSVGLGGVGGNRSWNSSSYNGSQGLDSSAFNLGGSGTITVNGGGGGATLDGGSAGAGGSGGGGSYGATPGASSKEASGFGHAGGNGTTVGCAGALGGGGGGAGAVGEASGTDGSQHAGDGGPGRASTITGASITYAGGGGGGINTGSGCVAAGNPGDGGSGGGGAGGPKTVSTANADSRGLDGVANLGSGGGGASGNGLSGTTVRSGGNGGSGVIVLRYALPATLTLDNEGTLTTQTLGPGATPTNPAATRTGFTLTGWSDAADNSAEYAADLSDYTMGVADDTVYAVWQTDLLLVYDATDLASYDTGTSVTNLGRTGSTNNATLSGGMSVTGQAFDFPDSNTSDFIDIGGTLSSNHFRNGFTVDFYAAIPSSGNWDRILDFAVGGGSATPGYNFNLVVSRLSNENKLSLHVAHQGGGSGLHSWCNAASSGSFDGTLRRYTISANASGCTMYVQGSSVGVSHNYGLSTSTDFRPVANQAWDNLYIGRSNYANDLQKGSIRSLRILTNVYTPSQIDSLYSGDLTYATLSFDSNGGTDPSDLVTSGSLRLPSPGARSGFSFGGWFADETYTTSLGVAGDSYTPGDTSLHAQWIGDALTPTFGTPTRTADGFTVSITNYDANFTWGSPTVSAGSVSAGTPSGSTQVLTVTGLNPEQSATITQTTSRTGYSSGSATVTSSAQTGAALTPSFGSITPTPDGYTVQISNYDANFTWAGTATASGSVAISGTGLVTVTGVAAGTTSALSVTTTRSGYTSGSGNTSGIAALVVDLDASNSSSYPGTGTTWTNLISGSGYTISNGTFSSNNGGAIVFNGTSTRVPLGQPLSNGASYTKEAWVFDSGTSGPRNILSSSGHPLYISGTELRGGLANNFNLVNSANFPRTLWKHVVLTFNDSTNTMSLYIDGVRVSQNTGVTSSYTQQNMFIGAHADGSGNGLSWWNGSIAKIRVYNTALTDSQVTSRFDATKAAYSLSAALNPTFGSPTATADGFTVQITNFDSDFTWAGTATASGTVSISGTGLVTVTGVAANTSSTATITTTRTSYEGGSATVSATSLASYTVTWDSNSGSSVSSANFVAGATISEPSPPTRSGKVFAGWSVSETSNQGDLASRIDTWPHDPASDTNFTLYAIWLDSCSPTSTRFVGTGTSDITSSTYGTSGVTYTQLVFDSLTDCGWSVPVGVSALDVLIVAGGGSAGFGQRAGGGGAGEVLYSPSPLSVSAGHPYLVDVGAGGTHNGATGMGSSGLDSRFGPYFADGGGAGGGGAGGANFQVGQDGGSGGGSPRCVTATRGVTTSSDRYADLTERGNSAGSVIGGCTDVAPGSGGGGAGSVGNNSGSGLTRNGAGGNAIKVFGRILAGGGAAWNSGTGLGGAFEGTIVGGSWAGGSASLKNGVPGTGSGASSQGAGGSGIIVVRFETPYRTLTLDNEGSTTTQSVAIGDSPSDPTSVTRTGYTLSGWSDADDNSAEYAANLSDYTMGTTNDTLYAVWTVNTFTITFNAGSVSGSSGSDQTTTKTYGTNLTLPNSATANGYFTKSGYTVAGWSVNADGSTTDFALGGSYTTEAADTLYPVWEPNEYVVTYTYNGATGGNSISTITYTVDGIQVSLPSPTKTGYTFAGWYSNVGLTSLVGAGGASYAPSADITLYAKWSAATFTVVFNYNGATGGNSDDDDQYTTDGLAITLPTPTRDGYTFGGWYSDVGLTTSVGAAGASYTPSLNLTIYAKWTAISRSVTYNTTNSTSGTAPTDGATYIIGDQVTVKANSGSLRRTGYDFAGWVTNSNGTGTPLNAGENLTVSTANISLYPKWTAATYTITYHRNGATGSLARATDSFTTGNSNVTLPGAGTLSKTGYTFGGWSTSPTGADVGATYSTTENVTLYAVWTIKSISYTYAKGFASGASLSSFSFTAPFPSGTSRNYGSSITLSTSIDAEIDADGVGGVDHKFFGWSDGSTVYDAGALYILGETNPTFTAQWAPVFGVRYSLGGGAHSGSDGETDSQCLGGDDTCSDGQSLTLNEAPTRPGYTFVGWENQVGTVFDAEDVVTVTATNYLFYAKWQAIQYTIGFNSLGGTNVISNQSKTIGQVVTMPDPGSKTGYSFGGWSDGSLTYGIGSTFTVAASSKSFSAQWIPDVYAVVYDWQGGYSVTPKTSDSYTVGTGDMTLPTAAGHGYTRDGYTFSGWSQSVNGTRETGFQPTANDVLYALWANGNYTLTYDAQGGTIISNSASVARTTSTILPTPTRANFTLVGWYTASTGGTKIGDAGDTFAPTASTTMYARWVQDSLYGVDEATLETATTTITADGTVGNDQSASATSGGSRADVVVPGGALPDGTVVKIRYFRDTDRQSSLISGDNTYFFSVLVSWLYGTGTTATVPDTHPSRPIEVTLTNSSIKAGARVYQVIGTQVTDLGVAVADGSVTVELFADPQLVVAATAPGAPTGVSGTSGDTRVTVSWTAGSSGGSPITGYTVTASPGGATCSTSTTSCVIGSLTNNTAYTFRVTATNALGPSSASTASASVTPLGANYTVTFDSNGGSSVSAGSFFSGSTVSAPSNPSRSGYVFNGWSTVQGDASTKVTFPYAPGVTSAITLYGLWTVAPPASSSGGGGVGPGQSSSRPGNAPVIPPGRVLSQLPPIVPPRVFSAPVLIVPERGFDPSAGSQAIVGGLPATVTKTSPVEGGVSVGVGRVQVGITPNQPQSFRPSTGPGPLTDVAVSTGQSATVAGGGLLPGSQLQVWLPGLSGTTPKELARIPVKPDGTFESELVFSARQAETPVPIGRQVIQVTGFDERGNQTVVDMTITIGQGDPVPEPNRSVNALPDLGPGQSLATSAGLPELVEVQALPENREVRVLSGAWAFAVALAEDAGLVEEREDGAALSLVQSKTATVSGTGFQPDTRVDIWLFSDPTLLGSVTVASDGSFSGEVFLDARYAVVGEHTLQLQGVGTDGYVKAANLGVVVQEPITSTEEDAGELLVWILSALAMLFAAVMIAVIVVRRKSARRL